MAPLLRRRISVASGWRLSARIRYARGRSDDLSEDQHSLPDVGYFPVGIF